MQWGRSSLGNALHSGECWPGTKVHVCNLFEVSPWDSEYSPCHVISVYLDQKNDGPRVCKMCLLPCFTSNELFVLYESA